MKDAYVWTRYGDNDEYHQHDSPYDAGYDLGTILNFEGDQEIVMPELKYRNKGVELDGFTGMNYVSLFWGDDDAQPVDDAELTPCDKMDFELGIEEGLNC